MGRECYVRSISGRACHHLLYASSCCCEWEAARASAHLQLWCTLVARPLCCCCTFPPALRKNCRGSCSWGPSCPLLPPAAAQSWWTAWSSSLAPCCPTFPSLPLCLLPPSPPLPSPPAATRSWWTAWRRSPAPCCPTLTPPSCPPRRSTTPRTPSQRTGWTRPSECMTHCAGVICLLLLS